MGNTKIGKHRRKGVTYGKYLARWNDGTDYRGCSWRPCAVHV